MDAICIIDTSNQQRNVFPLSLFQSQSSTFKDLKGTETRADFKFTTDALAAEGAINLTWYPRKSPQFFHDIRFLIPPSEPYDAVMAVLNIGAQTATPFILISHSVGGLIVRNNCVPAMKIIPNETLLRQHSTLVWAWASEPGIVYRNRYWHCTDWLLYNSVEDVVWECKVYNHKPVRS